MGRLIQHAMTSLAKESPDFKKALNVSLKYEIYTLLQRLSDNGEESVVITASVSDGVKSHLGSRKGEAYLQEAEELLNASLKERFLQFCGGNYSLTSQPANTSVNISVNTTANVSTNLPINPVANEPVIIKTEPAEPEPAEDPAYFHSPNKQSRLSPMENQTPSRQVRTPQQVGISSSLSSTSATEAVATEQQPRNNNTPGFGGDSGKQKLPSRSSKGFSPNYQGVSSSTSMGQSLRSDIHIYQGKGAKRSSPGLEPQQLPAAMHQSPSRPASSSLMMPPSAPTPSNQQFAGPSKTPRSRPMSPQVMNTRSPETGATEQQPRNNTTPGFGGDSAKQKLPSRSSNGRSSNYQGKEARRSSPGLQSQQLPAGATEQQPRNNTTPGFGGDSAKQKLPSRSSNGRSSNYQGKEARRSSPGLQSQQLPAGATEQQPRNNTTPGFGGDSAKQKLPSRSSNGRSSNYQGKEARRSSPGLQSQQLPAAMPQSPSRPASSSLMMPPSAPTPSNQQFAGSSKTPRSRPMSPQSENQRMGTHSRPFKRKAEPQPTNHPSQTTSSQSFALSVFSQETVTDSQNSAFNPYMADTQLDSDDSIIRLNTPAFKDTAAGEIRQVMNTRSPETASKVAQKDTHGRLESSKEEIDEKTPKKKVPLGKDQSPITHFMRPSAPGHHHGDHKGTYVEGHGDQSDSGIQGNRAMKVKAHLDFSHVRFESKPGLEVDKAIEIEGSDETTSGKIAGGKSTSGKYTAGTSTSGKGTAVKSTSGKNIAVKSTSGKGTAVKSTSGKFTAGKSTSGKYIAGKSTSGKFTAGQCTSGKYTDGHSTSGKDTAGQSTSSKDTAGQSTCGPSTADTSAGHQSSSGKSPAEEKSVDFNIDEYVQQRECVCPICAKSYKQKRYLMKHMKIHGEKKFACSFCDKAFVFRYESKRHMLNAHRKEMSEHAASKVAKKGTPGRSESSKEEMDASWTPQQPGRSILNLPKSPRSEKTPKKKVHFESEPGFELDKAIKMEVSGETTSGRIAAGKSTSGKGTAVKSTSGKYTVVKSRSGKYTAVQSTSGKGTAGKSTSGRYISGKSTSGKYTAGKSISGKYIAGKSTSGKFTAGKSTSGKYTDGQSTSGPSTANTSAGHQSSGDKSAAEEKSDGFNIDEYIEQISKDIIRECYRCGYKTKQADQYIKHLQTCNTHTLGREFVCPICAKSFKLKGYLSKHMKIHGEKKFACTICDKAFVVPYRKKRHMLDCHGKERSEHAWE